MPEGGSNLGVPSSPFVIEGDEYDSAFFDKRSKFIHYRPRVLAVNNLEFDHADIFRDLFDVKRTFTHVRRIVSPLGAIVENGDDENIASLEPTPWVRRLKVGFGVGCDVRISGFAQSGESSSFRLSGFGVEKAVEWPLAGEFNARNAAMAIVGASLAGGFANPLAVPADCLSNFRGGFARLPAGRGGGGFRAPSDGDSPDCRVPPQKVSAVQNLGVLRAAQQHRQAQRDAG